MTTQEKKEEEEKANKDNPSVEQDLNDQGSEEEETLALVTQLQSVYPDVPRGTIYEAVNSIKYEDFLLNYLKDLQARNTHVEKAMTIGDLFSVGDNKEVSTIVGFGKKTGLSKGMTIAAAITLSLSKTVYSIFSDDTIKGELDKIEITHSKNLLERAKALAKTDSDRKKENDKTKETK